MVDGGILKRRATLTCFSPASIFLMIATFVSNEMACLFFSLSLSLVAFFFPPTINADINHCKYNKSRKQHREIRKQHRRFNKTITRVARSVLFFFIRMSSSFQKTRGKFFLFFLILVIYIGFM